MPRGTYATHSTVQWWTRRNGGRVEPSYKDAARNLSVISRRFLNDRASVREVTEAYRLFLESLPPSMSPPDTKATTQGAQGDER